MDSEIIKLLVNNSDKALIMAILDMIALLFFLKTKIALLEKHRLKIIIILVVAFLAFALISIIAPYLAIPGKGK